MNTECTMKELAEMVGYTYRRIHDIDDELEDGDKLFVKGAGGRYLLDMFVQRWARYQVARATSGDRDLEQLKAQHEEVKIERARAELGKLKGELLDAREVTALWVNAATRCRQRFMEIPARVTPQLIGENDEKRITQIIDSEIRAALVWMAELPRETDEDE